MSATIFDGITFPKQPVIAVCIPLADQIHAATFTSIMGLDIPKPYHLLDRRGAPVEQARNDLVARVLFDPAFKDVTHLLWIDDDMVFTPDALRRLLAHDLAIVGGLCHGRRAPHYAPILCHKQANSALGYTYQHDYPQGLVTVDATGGAFILVKREVYEEIERRFPTPGEGPYTNRGCGEDISFCERAAECGYKTVVDTTLEIGHIAEVVVDAAFARRNRLAEFAPWFPPVEGVAPGAPVASIVIPTWNQKPELLRAAVESALLQTAPVEVIVVDNGSDVPVKMADILVGDTPWAGDERIRLLRLEHNVGPWPALNLGARAMRTDWFCWLSSDDTFKPTKVERQLHALLATNSKVGFHGYDVLLPSGNLAPQAVVPTPWRSIVEQQHVLAGCCAINGLTAMIHKSVFDEVGYFDEDFYIAADWEMWNRIGKKHLWHVLPDILATRRGFDNSSERYANSPVMKAKWIDEDAAIRSRYTPNRQHGMCGCGCGFTIEDLGAADER